MKSYRYELIVYKIEYHKEYGKILRKIKRFLGNNIESLQERFEMWFIKQSLSHEEIDVYVGEIPHIGY